MYMSLRTAEAFILNKKNNNNSNALGYLYSCYMCCG